MEKSNELELLKQEISELKKEVFDELSIWDLGCSETIDTVNEIIFDCGKKISEILSDYFLRWESIKEQRDGFINSLENQYPNLSKKEIRRLVVEYLKEYWNSDDYKEGFGCFLSSCIKIEDIDY